MSKSVLDTLYSVKKCLIDSLSVLFEVRMTEAAVEGRGDDAEDNAYDAAALPTPATHSILTVLKAGETS